MAYIYQADIYCDRCGEDIRRRLTAEGLAPANPIDETTFDSDDFPKVDGEGYEVDCPQHCGSGADCLEPEIIGGEKYGKLLEHVLTKTGADYVRSAHAEDPNEVTAYWMERFAEDLEGWNAESES